MCDGDARGRYTTDLATRASALTQRVTAFFVDEIPESSSFAELFLRVASF
jgi:hypothetical protein